MGDGSFGNKKIISELAKMVTSVIVSDIDRDGDLDVVSATNGNDLIAWYENTNGQGDFGEQQIVSDAVNNPMSVFSCDIDGDGNQDLLSASYGDNKIAWYENLTTGGGPISIGEIISYNNIKYYPNPTTGILHLDFNDNNIQQLTFTDITGNQLLVKTQVQQNESLDLSGYASGIYFIGIQSGQETIVVKVCKE